MPDTDVKKPPCGGFLARGRRNYFFSSAAGAAGAAASAAGAAGAAAAGAGAGAGAGAAASSFLPQADRAAAAIRAAITRVLFIFRSKKFCQDDHWSIRRHHPETTTGVTFAALTIPRQRSSSLSMIKPKPGRDNPDKLFFVAKCQQNPGTPPGSVRERFKFAARAANQPHAIRPAAPWRLCSRHAPNARPDTARRPDDASARHPCRPRDKPRR